MKKLSILVLAIALLALLTPVVEARSTKSVAKTNTHFYASGCDMNGDGVTNLSDVSILASVMRTDLNGDGVFNLIDVSILARGIYTPGWCASTFN